MLRTYYYDSNPLDVTFVPQYAAGRLTAIQYANPAGDPQAPFTKLQFTEMYSYKISGLPTKKRLQMNQSMTWTSGFQQITQPRLLNLDASYDCDDEGRMAFVTYPNTTQLSGDYYRGEPAWYPLVRVVFKGPNQFVLIAAPLRPTVD